MKSCQTTGMEQLRSRMDEAKRALLLDCGRPCRGHVYPYRRGGRRYWKWERREAGRRVQRTVGVEGMEALVAGIADRAQFEERLQHYYKACEEYVAAAGNTEEESPAQKKRASSAGRRKSGGRR